MSLVNQLRELVTERKTALDDANKIISTAAKEKRAMTAEETQEFEKRHEAGATLLTRIEQVEKQIHAEGVMKEIPPDNRRAGMEDIKHTRTEEGTEADEKRMEDMAMTHFRAWCRGGMEALPASEQAKYRQAMEDLDPAERRTLTSTSASSGGALVPQGFVRQLESAMLYYGGIIQAADYIDTDDGAPLIWPTDNDTSNNGELLAEGSDTAADEDPSFGSVTFNAYLLSSKIVKVPIQLLDDAAFSVDQYLGNKLPERIGRQLNNLCTLANGSSTINGIVNAATAGVTIFPAATVGYSDLIDLEYSVDVAYRSGPKVGWMMHDSTVKVIRKLTDDSNNPIFRVGSITEGLATNREPDRLNGYPLWRNNDMATPAQGAKTILFGDFSKYKIRRVKGMRMLRLVERYAEYFQVGFVAFQRFDGDLLDAGTNPVKYLTQGAS